MYMAVVSMLQMKGKYGCYNHCVVHIVRAC